MNKKIGVLLAVFLCFCNATFAFTKLHETVKEERISSGVILKNYKLLTTEGWLDYNFLEVDLKDKNTSVELLNSENGLNTFQTTLEMAKANQAIAAVNGDFFGGNYLNGYTVGLSMKDGKFLTSSYYGNEVKDAFATFLLDENNTPLIDYLVSTISIQSMLTGENFTIKEYNRSSDNYETKPSLFTREWGEKSIGSFDYLALTEMVVENNVVTEIRVGQEACEIPEDGFVVCTALSGGEFIQNNFKVGTRVSLSISHKIDLEEMKMAISGGAVLVKDGRIPEKFSSNITGRNPRTALGISKDNTKIYLVTVDGRMASSFGATQTELAEFLLEKGVYNAINLDGGGSTTMVAQKLGNSNLSVINTPSGGVLRKVTNSLGIINIGKETSLDALIIEADDENVFVNCKRKLTIKGYDKNYHPVEIDIDDVHFSTEGVNGNVEDGVLHAGEEPGVITVEAKKGKVSVKKSFNVLSAPNEIEIIPQRTLINQNEKITFQTIVKNRNGYYGTIENDELTYNVISGDGYFENGTYTPTVSGTHLIEVSGGYAKSYAIVNVTPISDRTVDYITENNYEFNSYPSEVTGTISKYRNQYLKLKYNFEDTTAIRAAYLRFKTPIELNENDIRVSFPVLSKHDTSEIVKMKMIDKNGDAKLCTVQRGFSESDEFITLTYSLNDIQLPAKITDLYVAQDSSEVLSKGDFIFGKLTITSKETLEEENAPIPQKIKGEDVTNVPPSGEDIFRVCLYDKMVKTETMLDHLKNVKSLSQMEEEADLIILREMPTEEELENLTTPVLSPTSYSKTSYNTFDFITLDVSKGGLLKTDAQEWLNLKADIRNSSHKNILILMKGTLGDFTDSREKQLFIDVISDLRLDYQKNIWVISYQDYTEYSMEKRVKYLSVNNLNYNTKEPIEVALNTEYITISISNSEMTYEVKRVF